MDGTLLGAFAQFWYLSTHNPIYSSDDGVHWTVPATATARFTLCRRGACLAPSGLAVALTPHPLPGSPEQIRFRTLPLPVGFHPSEWAHAAALVCGLDGEKALCTLTGTGAPASPHLAHSTRRSARSARPLSAAAKKIRAWR